jgi:glycerophosphoryl diester phosphodiesterase
VTHPFFEPTPLILGHRGAAAHAPENTLLSFERAIELGAGVIESDVQVTRDGVPVLMHDDQVDRVTNGAGAVEAMSFSELQALDAGHHFSIGDRGELGSDADGRFRGRGLRVPSLEEAFQEFPGVRFNLEIKTAAPGVVERVTELVARYRRADDTLLTAADDAIMKAIRERLALQRLAAATGASVSEVVAVVRAAADGTEPPANIMALQIPTRFGEHPLVTSALVAHAQAHAIQLHVWTINDHDEMTRLLDLGVDGLVTDFPDRAAQAIARRSGS